jgi:hypothetical protein
MGSGMGSATRPVSRRFPEGALKLISGGSFQTAFRGRRSQSTLQFGVSGGCGLRADHDHRLNEWPIHASGRLTDATAYTVAHHGLANLLRDHNPERQRGFLAAPHAPCQPTEGQQVRASRFAFGSHAPKRPITLQTAEGQTRKRKGLECLDAPFRLS